MSETVVWKQTVSFFFFFCLFLEWAGWGWGTARDFPMYQWGEPASRESLVTAALTAQAQFEANTKPSFSHVWKINHSGLLSFDSYSVSTNLRQFIWLRNFPLQMKFFMSLCNQKTLYLLSMTQRTRYRLYLFVHKPQQTYCLLLHEMGLQCTNSFEAYLSLSRWADTHPAGYPTWSPARFPFRPAWFFWMWSCCH